MNQQACLFVEDRKALQNLVQSQGERVLKFSNRFRSFVFILKDHFENLQQFEEFVHENSVLSLNEMLAQFLTHTVEGSVIKEPIVTETTNRYWIHDVDAFISLPLSIQERLKNLGPHVYFYENFDFLYNQE